MQKDAWEREYREKHNVPSSRTYLPSKALIWFIEKYGVNDSLLKSALDLGSGNGRNTVYLAKHGYQVEGIEMIDFAVGLAKEAVRKESLEKAINFTVGSISDNFPFRNYSFDLIIDMMSLHLLFEDERKVYAKEVQRVLKPMGYYLFYTIDSESPAALDLFKNYPGPEKNSYVIPQTGVIEKAFSQNDLEHMFPSFKLLEIEKETKFTPAFGDAYERVYLKGLFQKTKS